MTIRTYSYFDALLVTNTSHNITGDDMGDFNESFGGGIKPYVAKTGSYTATEDDDVINVSSASNQSITLPACASTRVGKTYTIRKGSNAGSIVNVLKTGADTINGGTYVCIANVGDYITVQNTGAAWLIIGQHGWFNGLVYVKNTTNSFGNTTTEATLRASGGGFSTLPAAFYTANTVLRVKARGYVSNTGTPTLTMKVKHGSTVLASTGAITTASGLSNTGWALDATIVCRTTGASGTLMTQGEFRIGSTFYPMVNTATVTIDTTAAQDADVTGQWGTANVLNVIAGDECTFSLER